MCVHMRVCVWVGEWVECVCASACVCTCVWGGVGWEGEAPSEARAPISGGLQRLPPTPQDPSPPRAPPSQGPVLSARPPPPTQDGPGAVLSQPAGGAALCHGHQPGQRAGQLCHATRRQRQPRGYIREGATSPPAALSPAGGLGALLPQPLPRPPLSSREGGGRFSDPLPPCSLIRKAWMTWRRQGQRDPGWPCGHPVPGLPARTQRSEQR